MHNRWRRCNRKFKSEQVLHQLYKIYRKKLTIYRHTKHLTLSHPLLHHTTSVCTSVHMYIKARTILASTNSKWGQSIWRKRATQSKDHPSQNPPIPQYMYCKMQQSKDTDLSHCTLALLNSISSSLWILLQTLRHYCPEEGKWASAVSSRNPALLKNQSENKKSSWCIWITVHTPPCYCPGKQAVSSMNLTF